MMNPPKYSTSDTEGNRKHEFRVVHPTTMKSASIVYNNQLLSSSSAHSMINRSNKSRQLVLVILVVISIVNEMNVLIQQVVALEQEDQSTAGTPYNIGVDDGEVKVKIVKFWRGSLWRP